LKGRQYETFAETGDDVGAPERVIVGAEDTIDVGLLDGLRVTIPLVIANVPLQAAFR